MSGNPIEFGYLDHHPLEVTIFPRFTYALSPSLACFPSDGHHLENESKALSLHCLFPYGFFFFFCLEKINSHLFQHLCFCPGQGRQNAPVTYLSLGKQRKGKYQLAPSFPIPPLPRPTPPFLPPSLPLFPTVSTCSTTHEVTRELGLQHLNECRQHVSFHNFFHSFKREGERECYT